MNRHSRRTAPRHGQRSNKSAALLSEVGHDLQTNVLVHVPLTFAIPPHPGPSPSNSAPPARHSPASCLNCHGTPAPRRHARYPAFQGTDNGFAVRLFAFDTGFPLKLSHQKLIILVSEMAGC